jgi:hypothetical protein
MRSDATGIPTASTPSGTWRVSVTSMGMALRSPVQGLGRVRSESPSCQRASVHNRSDKRLR